MRSAAAEKVRVGSSVSSSDPGKARACCLLVMTVESSLSKRPQQPRERAACESASSASYSLHRLTVASFAHLYQAAAGFEGGAAPGPKEHLGFGFSAGGLLFPYYVGCYEALREEGLMTGERSQAPVGVSSSLTSLLCCAADASPRTAAAPRTADRPRFPTERQPRAIATGHV